MTRNFKFDYLADGRKKCLVNSSEDEYVRLTFEEDGRRRRVTVKALSDISLVSYTEPDFDPDRPEKFSYDKKGDLYFMNGYQSWTDTREYYGDARHRNVYNLPPALIRRYAFDRYGDATFYKYDKKILHGYDLFYSKGSYNKFIFSLNGKNAYLIFELYRSSGIINLISDLSGKILEKGEEFTVCDYAYADGYDEGVALMKQYFTPRRKEKIFGYTSWYNYYQNIDEKTLLRDLDGLSDEFDLFQIDDGYETFVGDWLSVDPIKFPNGLSPIVGKIHDKGLKAGIWLAPFVAEEKSKLFKEKPDLFKKGNDGKPVKCGSNWSGFYALDLENPDAVSYISDCLKAYSDMGFDFFKLDFLYAASLPSYKGNTRSEVADRAYSMLRNILGDKIILGCGGTLINAAEKFDYMRIGPDVSLDFDDVWFMRFMHRERVSTKVTLQNTVFRSFLNGIFFGNDPDVFLLRDDNIRLNAKQKTALITLNALFGSVMMTSDNLAEYDETKKALLQDARKLSKAAKVYKIARKDKIITIEYAIDGKSYTIYYDTEKGELINE
ncbi:MAG: alpha-galactosidase [Clostridia bacterium]|nr:alpha-galactosidase [Clostridia bacterium]